LNKTKKWNDEKWATYKKKFKQNWQKGYWTLLFYSS
jgi:hypothetical protein